MSSFIADGVGGGQIVTSEKSTLVVRQLIGGTKPVRGFIRSGVDQDAKRERRRRDCMVLSKACD